MPCLPAKQGRMKTLFLAQSYELSAKKPLPTNAYAPLNALRRSGRKVLNRPALVIQLIEACIFASPIRQQGKNYTGQHQREQANSWAHKWPYPRFQEPRHDLMQEAVKGQDELKN